MLEDSFYFTILYTSENYNNPYDRITYLNYNINGKIFQAEISGENQQEYVKITQKFFIHLYFFNSKKLKTALLNITI